MIDAAALRYFPNRVRWLFEQTSLGELAANRVGRSNADRPKASSVQVTATHLDLTDDTFADLKNLRTWTYGGEGLTVHDIYNHIDLIEPDDSERLPNSVFREYEFGDYFHFGKTISGHSGFFIAYNDDENRLWIAFAKEGIADSSLSLDEIVTRFLPFRELEIDLDQDTVFTALEKSQTLSNEEKPELRVALKHMIGVLKHIAVWAGSSESVYPSDAPQEEVRIASMIGINSGDASRAAELNLASRGWQKVTVYPLPVDVGLFPYIDPRGLFDPQARADEWQRYAHHFVAKVRDSALRGSWDYDASILIKQMEEIFSYANRCRAVETLETKRWGEEVHFAISNLAMAAYGKTYGNPPLDAAFVNQEGDEWFLQIGETKTELFTISPQTIEILAAEKLISLSRGIARPTERLKQMHILNSPVHNRVLFGDLGWLGPSWKSQWMLAD